MERLYDDIDIVPEPNSKGQEKGRNVESTCTLPIYPPTPEALGVAEEAVIEASAAQPRHCPVGSTSDTSHVITLPFTQAH